MEMYMRDMIISRANILYGKENDYDDPHQYYPGDFYEATVSNKQLHKQLFYGYVIVPNTPSETNSALPKLPNGIRSSPPFQNPVANNIQTLVRYMTNIQYAQFKKLQENPSQNPSSQNPCLDIKSTMSHLKYMTSKQGNNLIANYIRILPYHSYYIIAAAIRNSGTTYDNDNNSKNIYLNPGNKVPIKPFKNKNCNVGDEYFTTLSSAPYTNSTFSATASWNRPSILANTMYPGMENPLDGFSRV
jgi:hypothetical protein